MGSKEDNKIELELEAVARDAMRYRWMREQHWSESPLCVVKNPKDAVNLGYDCPSFDRLDEMIDDAMKTPNGKCQVVETAGETPVAP